MPAPVVDPKFVDVDFPSDPNYVFGDLGQSRFGAPMPIFEDSIETIPEHQWPAIVEEIDANGGHLENLSVEIKDQKQEGACVSDASAAAHQIVQAVQFGKDKVIKLSSISLYKRVARSAGSGSMLNDNLDELNEQGILPLDTPENKARFQHTMPNTGFHLSFPAGWKATAALFKGHEAFDIRTVAGLFTASAKGFPVVVGRKGHSIVYVRPTYRNGSLAFIYQNSWTQNWGFAMGEFSGGFGLDTLGTVKQSASWAFAIRSVNIPL